MRHTCDTPACVNPRHLIQGSYADNTMDALQRARGVGRTALTHEQVLDIYSSTMGRRALALKYGKAISCISDIKEGRSWWWLTGATRTYHASVAAKLTKKSP